MVNKMVEVGEIKKAAEIGKSGVRKYIWAICPSCGEGRWVRLVNGKPVSEQCKKCAIANLKLGLESPRYGTWL
jgi:uncharacterized protein (DUF983 family)